ncbi:MAG: hypothetical protein ABI594_21235 [Ginsengibacter sp.]
MTITTLFRFSFLVTLCVCVSCGFGSKDFIENLGDGYTYDGGNRLIFADNIFEDGIFPNVLSYNFDSSYIIATQEPSNENYKDYLGDDIAAKFSILLYSDTINEMDTYKRQFINSFWWTDTILRKKIANEIGPKNQKNIEKINTIVDSVIATNDYYLKMFARKLNYWIVLKKEKKLLGPFSIDEYKAARQELKIPETLKF